MRRTKTICTIGPASQDPHILEQLVLKGMDIVRLNFSHATYDQFLNIASFIHTFNQKHNKYVEMLIDLQGPRLRVGVLSDKGVNLEEGQTVMFSTDVANLNAIYISDPYLHLDIKSGQPLYLANGDLELKVERTDEMNIYATVIKGGILYSRKAVNVPDTNLTTSGLTEKDLKDIEFAKANNVDFLAMSFVKNAEEVTKMRTILGTSPIKIVSKIESKQGIINIDGIIDTSDMIMVARGDLGIEIPLEDIPLIQKEIIRESNAKEKPCIVATQVLMSMVNHYRPTRAEISDAANAVLDGAALLMLSDETAFGKYPVEALEYLIRVINKVEEFQSIS